MAGREEGVSSTLGATLLLPTVVPHVGCCDFGYDVHWSSGVVSVHHVWRRERGPVRRRAHTEDKF